MPLDEEHTEARLQETEIKLAFLEKELDAYKEAVQELHVRLAMVEKNVRELRELRDAAQDASGESESPDGEAS